MSEISRLNAQFGLSSKLVGKIKFESGVGGLVVLHVDNQFAQVSLCLQGAHLLSWLPKSEQEDVIWISKEAVFSSGRSIRGGIPLCWPWFGAHPTKDSLPSHGFARVNNWKVLETKVLTGGIIYFSLQLSQDTVKEEYRVDGAELELQVRVGEKLEMSLITRNSANKTITVGGAFHTYFNISNIQDVTILGLDDQRFIDTLDNWTPKKEAAPIRINEEIDRIYFDSPNIESIVEDPGFGRRVKISKKGSHSTVVWNPWIDKSKALGDMGIDGYKNMICVETSNAADDVITIEAGGEHCLSVCYQLERL